jgi:hypothetical protein
VVRYDKSTAERGRRYVRDQRGTGGGGLKLAGGGIGAVVIAVLAAFFGLDLGGEGGGFPIDGGFEQDAGSVAGDGPGEVIDPDADTVAYLEFLMFDIQDTWAEYFERVGSTYTETVLTIFTGSVSTGCGQATSAVGPFYCPAPDDRGVYLDLDFFDELSSRFGAPGDFAQAYVVAHEIGHHVQSITGISTAVDQARAGDPSSANEYSVRQELQADCLAGVWAYSASNRLTRESGVPIIEEGDISEGLAAAAAVGDDRIQAQAGVTVDPHTWTHGSAEQRVRWFEVGFSSGDPEQCDTFAAAEL